MNVESLMEKIASNVSQRLYSTYYVLGNALCILHILTHLYLTITVRDKHIITMSILQMKQLRHR